MEGDLNRAGGPAMKPIPAGRPWWLLPPGQLNPAWWVLIGGILLTLDYVSGLYSIGPALYVIPVTLAAWYSGLGTALALAIATPVAHAGILLLHGGLGQLLPQFIVMAIVRGVVIAVMALWVARLAQHEQELLRRVETLEGLLHICAFCKSIRNEQGEWERLEKVISERSQARFSHGFCPTCMKTHYPEMEDEETSAG
jgi:hypothetical protein